MIIAIFGSDGQLGRDLQTALSAHEVEPVPHDAADVTDAAAVSAAIERIAPAWIINAAAMTNVDLCETEAERAFAVNGEGARHVAAGCAAAGARLIHVSTDYVFDGRKRKPYVETDATNPLNVYGRSKLAGERAVTAATPAHFIVRSSGLYGAHPPRGKGGSNFVETILRLAGERRSLRVVEDEVLAPTFTEDLAAVIARLIRKEPPYGVYHATNDGECSWFEFAVEVLRVAGVKAEVARTTAAEWNAPARRPHYSVLANAALHGAGIDTLPNWRDALARYMTSRRIP